MINKKAIGRLGNQMFQYATIRAFALENNLTNEKVDYDLSIHYAAGFNNDIINFNLKSDIQYKKLKNNFFQNFLIIGINCIKIKNKIFSKISKNNYDQLMYNSEKRIQPFINRFGLYYFSRGYYNFKNYNSKNKSFYGTFESYKYFDKYKKEIQDEFTPKYGILEKNKDIYKQIEESESVCVTIRRGDFVSVEKHKKRFYICTPEYFEKAIELIKQEIKNPKFFIFSDDIDWCKRNMNLPKNCVFETGDDPVWEKLRMMYSCKHFIISNSTFSWWAQYLSKNENKIVVAPSKWKRETYNNVVSDLYEDDWKTVEVD